MVPVSSSLEIIIATARMPTIILPLPVALPADFARLGFLAQLAQTVAMVRPAAIIYLIAKTPIFVILGNTNIPVVLVHAVALLLAKEIFPVPLVLARLVVVIRTLAYPLLVNIATILELALVPLRLNHVSLRAIQIIVLPISRFVPRNVLQIIVLLHNALPLAAILIINPERLLVAPLVFALLGLPMALASKVIPIVAFNAIPVLVAIPLPMPALATLAIRPMVWAVVLRLPLTTGI